MMNKTAIAHRHSKKRYSPGPIEIAMEYAILMDKN
jgi:hypothetical protein